MPLQHSIGLLFYLFAGHFVADYPLQGDTVAREKNRHSTSELQKMVPWYWWLTAHAFAHSLVVALITHSALCVVLEFASHFVLDFMKCEKKISMNQDQLGHLFMKCLYVALIFFAPGIAYAYAI